MQRPLSSLALIVGAAWLAGVAIPAPADPAAPAVDAQPIVTLGRLLFFDAGLSEPTGQACATCHEPGHAFTDPDAKRPTSKGAHRDRFGSRNTPSAMYMAYSPPLRFDETAQRYVGGQFWDGRAASLEEQAKGPLLNPVEMANPDPRTVVAKVRASSRLAPRFEGGPASRPRNHSRPCKNLCQGHAVPISTSVADVPCHSTNIHCRPPAQTRKRP